MSKGKYDVWCKNCGCKMKLRHGKFGDFWGCTGYPICKNTTSTRDAALEEVLPEEDKKDNWRD